MTIEPYNYNDEPSGRTETLTQALDKCERLEKQLDIAIKVLEDIEKAESSTSYMAYCALQQIRSYKNE